MRQLRKIRLSEALNPNKFGGASKYTGAVRGGGGTNGNNNNKPLVPRVTHCTSKMIKSAKDGSDVEIFEGYIVFITFNKEKEACDAINSKIPSIPGSISILRAEPTKQKDKYGNEKTKLGGITLYINARFIKDIVAKYAGEVADALKSLGYDSSKVESQLINEIAKCPSQDDIKAMEKSIGANYKEMLKNLQNLQFQNKMFALQVQNDWTRKYGFVYAMKNAMAVKMAVPNATFVTTANGWAKYNRTVKPGATKIIVTIPDYRWIPRRFKDRAAIEWGYKDWLDAYTQLKDVSKQMIHAIEIKASKLMGTNTSHLQVVYDVSDTIPPKDPSKDLWANQKGLLDNLTGVLNPIAQKEYSAANPQQQQPQTPVGPPTDEAAKRQYNETRLTILLKKFGWEKINIPPLKSGAKLDPKQGLIIDSKAPNDALVDDIIKLSYDYSMAIEEKKFNILEPKMKSRIAGYACLGIAYVSGYDINGHGLQNFRAKNDNYDEQECAVAFKIATEIIPSQKNENKNNFKNGLLEDMETIDNISSGRYISFDEFLRRAEEELGAPEDRIMERREVKKNFVNFFNRMVNL
jgi:hypothetical protein